MPLRQSLPLCPLPLPLSLAPLQMLPLPLLILLVKIEIVIIVIDLGATTLRTLPLPLITMSFRPLEDTDVTMLCMFYLLRYCAVRAAGRIKFRL